MEPADNSVSGEHSQHRDHSHAIFRNLKDQDKLELKLVRRFLLEIFEVDSLDKIISTYKSNEGRKEELRKKLVVKYCTMLGIEGSADECLAIIKSALKEASQSMFVLEDPQVGLLRHLRGTVGTLNEVSMVNDPVDLLLMCFSDKASRRMRYEARRKLLLCDLAMRSKVENRDIERRLDSFSTFLGKNVWSSNVGAELENIEFLSHHSPKNYACTAINILGEGEKADVSEFVQYHKFGMRPWKNMNGEEKFVMFEHRGKSDAAQVIKMLRKDTKNVNAIDDTAGFKMTFTSKKDIYEFLELLQHVASQNGSAISYEEIYDTIDNSDDFRVTNAGSSSRLEIVKVHLRLNGILIELQMHTLRTFIDSRMHDEFGFEEYALSRLFQRGKFSESVVDLLYPPDVYGGDVQTYYDELLADVRESKRVRSHFLPTERSKDSSKIIRYSDSDLVSDVETILDQIDLIPDLIIAVGKSGVLFARELAMHFPGSKIVVFDDKNGQDIAGMDGYSKKQVLIVDDIGERCSGILKVKGKFPNAKVAVLGKRDNATANSVVDYFARSVSKEERMEFVWNRGMEKSESQVFALGIIWRRHKNGIQMLFEITPDGKHKLPGGRVEPSDGFVDAGFARELNEEIGIIDGKAKRIDDLSYTSDRNHVFQKSFARFYSLKLKRTPRIVPNDEVAQLVWIDVTQAVEKLSTPEFKEPLYNVLEKLGFI